MNYNLIFYSINKLITLLSTIYCKLILSIQGIKYGKHISFRGVALVLKGSGTEIIIGNNCSFNSNCRFNFRGMAHKCILQTAAEGRIKIGDNCGFSGVSIVSSIGVTIGNNVMCGTNVMIGDRNDHEDLYPQFKPAPIVIGNNVWIGANVTILSGITIGDNAVIGAGSIVTKDIPSNALAYGNPAKVIKSIP